MKKIIDNLQIKSGCHLPLYLLVGGIVCSLTPLRAQATDHVENTGFVEDVAPIYNTENLAPEVKQQVQNAMNQGHIEVTINNRQQGIFVTYKYGENDKLLVNADDLTSAGLTIVPEAKVDDEWVDISKLPDVVFTLDSAENRLDFHTSSDAALVPYHVSLNPAAWSDFKRKTDDLEGKPTSDPSAVLNYTLYADNNKESLSDVWAFSGVSGNFDLRLSSKYGVLSSNQIARVSNGRYNNTVRLDTFWSYSNPETMVTYRAGDLITRGLSWTRSTRLGGVQYRRNFALRSDLVTMPLPSVSGSAAVPSSVDVFVNNTKRVTEDLPSGPFSLTNIPVVTGAGTARVVVRDALGRETVTETDFFASNDMLAKGLLDFSFEAGVPRRSYGWESNEYDGNVFSSATMRYGLHENLTVEGHAEVGVDLYNAGGGVVFNVGSLGVINLASAASQYKGETGYQIIAGLDAEYNDIRFTARTQQTFDRFNDIASVVDRSQDEYQDKESEFVDWGYFNRSYDYRPPKAVNQFSVTFPLRFDPTYLSFSFTQVDNWEDDDSNVASFSTSRSFDNGISVYASAFMDVKRSNNFGVFTGLTYSFADKYTAGVSTQSDTDGTSVTSELQRTEGRKIGDYGWTLRDMEGDSQNRMAAGSYRSSVARVSGSVEQNNDSFRGTAQIEGAIVVADKSIFAANQIFDSFAVVDAGAPDVSVLSSNQEYGKTGRNGKLVVSDLFSYRKNQLSIDPDSLPLGALVQSTNVQVNPAYMSGVVAEFGVNAKVDYALLQIVDEDGAPIDVGSYVYAADSADQLVTGYDGIVMLPNANKQPASITVKQLGKPDCHVTLGSKLKLGIEAGNNRLVCKI
ncbi:fimbria/pilus outer membrane usher protein [Bartonella sp. LJL80]